MQQAPRSEEKGPEGRQMRAYLQIRSHNGTAHKHVQQRPVKNNRKCLPATKCQRRLQELWEIHIEGATFPRVQKACFEQTTRLPQKGHTTTFRHTSHSIYTNAVIPASVATNLAKTNIYSMHGANRLQVWDACYRIFFFFFVFRGGEDWTRRRNFQIKTFIFRCARDGSVGVVLYCFCHASPAHLSPTLFLLFFFFPSKQAIVMFRLRCDGLLTIKWDTDSVCF